MLMLMLTLMLQARIWVDMFEAGSPPAYRTAAIHAGFELSAGYVLSPSPSLTPSLAFPSLLTPSTVRAAIHAKF